jgi:outer membrane protein OmpA-like peptidoglycan-associated protein
VNAAHESPTISDDILFSQPTSEEKEAVNQKNRRVEIKVVGKREE